jgi:hypothetical protein
MKDFWQFDTNKKHKFRPASLGNQTESELLKFWQRKGWISPENVEILTGVKDLVEGQDYEVISSTINT